MSKRFLLFFVALFAAFGSLGVFASELFKFYSPLGSADLAEVEYRVGPNLSAELSSKGLSLGSTPFIRIFKQSSELEVWLEGENGQFVLFKTYPICHYSGELGPKLKEGDHQAPEGFYQVSADQMNPNSRYHLSFNLGFPNAFDRAHGRTGSFLMVHGNCVSIGCYAMTNEWIEEIYLIANESFKNGVRSFDVHIFPFRMTSENLRDHQNSKWNDFWEQLKLGFLAFERTNVPPKITVKSRKYSVSMQFIFTENEYVVPPSKRAPAQ